MPEAHVNPLPAIAVINGNQSVPIADSPDNILERDVVGNKNDTVAGTSIVSLLRQIEGTGFATGVDSLKVLSDMLDLIRTELTFQLQPDAVLTQVNPVQNTWYTILDTTLNAKIYFVRESIATTVEDIEVRFTVDGQVFACAGGITQIVDTGYYWFLANDGVYSYNSSNSVMLNNTGSQETMEFRSVKVEIRKTTNAGAGTLTARLRYSKR